MFIEVPLFQGTSIALKNFGYNLRIIFHDSHFDTIELDPPLSFHQLR